MSAHTPGPDASAIRLRDVGDAHCLYFGNHGRPFATMYHANMPREKASSLMATLAAAPDLLAALRDLTSAEGLPDGYADRKALITSARAAIAKAGGR